MNLKKNEINELSTNYSYDNFGRMNSVSSSNFPSGASVDYEYLANSDLINRISFPNGLESIKTYEAHCDLLLSIENKNSSQTFSQYLFENDELARRRNVVHSGIAFENPHFNLYAYNDRSELQSSRTYLGTNTNDTSAPIINRNRDNSFDPIGNRINSTSSESGSPITWEYTTINLNQYTAISNPSTFPTYDDDGNCTSAALESGEWTFTWDAENRLIAAEKSGLRLEFKYDYMSRRAEKRVLNDGIETSKKHFVYDGYKLIEELDGQNLDAILRKYVWNGETPFSMTDADGTFYYVLDANKNVSELVDITGSVRAHYEYSPFGEITVITGDKAVDNPIRFSSEYFDVETGLVYYNFRYYSPSLGRWLSRDPIYERGSVAWFQNEDDRLFRKNILADIKKIKESLRSLDISDVVINKFSHLERKLEHRVNSDTTGSDSDNPYIFCSNSAVNSYDILGLLEQQYYSRLQKRLLSWGCGKAKTSPTARSEYIKRVKETMDQLKEFDKKIQKGVVEKKAIGATSELGGNPKFPGYQGDYNSEVVQYVSDIIKAHGTTKESLDAIRKLSEILLSNKEYIAALLDACSEYALDRAADEITDHIGNEIKDKIIKNN